MSHSETTELVRALRQGDQQAFNRLVLLYQAKIYNLALGYVKQEDEAKDLTQDIFITVFRRIDRLRDDEKFVSWLYQLAVNHCRNRYKKLARRGFFRSSSIDEASNSNLSAENSDPAVQLERSRTTQMVRSAIDSLDEAEKEIIILRDMQDLAYDEISTVLDIPMGTVKSKLNRARGSLKKRLKQLM